ncbi:twin-arginine translocase subunit TatC [Helicobacter canis]|uniref:Sec-independent protein translocase protein TatC n=1 Tax=Helicobacter canis TaxID=29419 RepID=A0A5M9QIT9_9HELI|nr:twin-arginine translocase subunit TatC [Helicobacter canis]KAA8707797.1 twin-arginine translocase subunit TatC [Helicobacter canis]
MFEELKPHIQDLRKRLIIALVSVIAAFIVCFAFWKQIFAIVKIPIESAFADRVQGTLMQLTPLEGIFSAMSLSFLAAFTISTPIIFWQLWLFVAPGLYKNEKKIILPFVGFGTAMFILGALFAYFIIFPFMIEYILLFGNDMFEANISVESYVGFFIRVVLGFGIAFELPVLAYFLARVGMITDESLKKFFKYAVVIIFVVAAIITPPDPFSQLLMAIPLVLLYGLSILIAKSINPAKKPLESSSEPTSSDLDS